MHEFLDTALGFPAVIFSFLLIVVIGYWLLVLLGGTDLDADGDPGTGLLAGLGLGGVPFIVAFSPLIALAWFLSLVGGVLIHRRQLGNAQLEHLGSAADVRTGLSIAVLLMATIVAWLVTRQLVRPLRYMMPDEKQPSRNDFVGRMCVIRTGRVDLNFGQAEVRAADGSTAVIQVRQMAPSPERAGNQIADSPLKSGSTALIFEYDADRRFFWVMPYDAELDPDRRPTP